jgi:hypothetical protein
MEISLGLAEALARFAYVQMHRAETSEANRASAAKTLVAPRSEETIVEVWVTKFKATWPTLATSPPRWGRKPAGRREPG